MQTGGQTNSQAVRQSGVQKESILTVDRLAVVVFVTHHTQIGPQLSLAQVKNEHEPFTNSNSNS